MTKTVCDLCKEKPKGDFWTVSCTDGDYCYQCAYHIEYEER